LGKPDITCLLELYEINVRLRRDEVLAKDSRAMSEEEMAQVPAIPSPTALAELKMQEMLSIIFIEKK